MLLTADEWDVVHRPKEFVNLVYTILKLILNEFFIDDTKKGSQKLLVNDSVPDIYLILCLIVILHNSEFLERGQ